MILDARTLPIEAPLAADIAIIGGGAAGISLALNYLNASTRVILLESGGLTYERNTQALYKGENIGLRYEPLDLCRLRMLGGSTDKRGWAGWCKTFDEVDFEHRDWVALSGWPIKKRDLAPYYERALKTVYLPTDFEGRSRTDAHAADCLALGTGHCVNDPVALSTAPHLADVWLETLRSSENIKVILHANVTKIETDRDGGTVTGIRFASLERRTFLIAPRFTVLAAGGLETPRLLLVSNQTVKPGLGNRSGWVGRCFMDHPRFAWGQITSIPSPELLIRYNPTHGVGQRLMGLPPPGAKPLFGSGISVRPDVQRRERILGSRTWILPISAQGERPAGRELRELVLWAMRHRLPSDTPLRGKEIIKDLPNAAASAIAHLRSVAGLSTRWQFVTIMEPEPNSESRVTLGQQKDPLGLPRIRLDWRLTDLVEHSLARTQELVIEDLRSIGIQCFKVGPGGEKANQTVAQPRWVWHHMGTTKMSDDPKNGVVDADCKVHGLNNLFIAGSSVFPTCSTDMPTVTLLALAHRLADHLKARLNVALGQRSFWPNAIAASNVKPSNSPAWPAAHA